MLVKKIFALRDRQALMVHTESFDWDWNSLDSVLLKFDDSTAINCSYISKVGLSVNEYAEKEPVLYLELNDEDYDKAEDVKSLFDEYEGRVFIDRPEEPE